MADLQEEDDDDKPKKLSTGRKVRMGIIFTLALVAAGVLVYTKWLVKKADLGGPCTYAFQCGKDAPKCMRAEEDETGICTRTCEPTRDGGAAQDCAPGIPCMKGELEERDDRGMPIQGGYCIPQSVIDAQHNKGKDGGVASSSDSWLDVPKVGGQLEADVTLQWNRGGKDGTAKSYVVKGSLVRVAGSGSKRLVVNTSGLRTFVIDDDKKTFSATVMDSPQGDVKLEKTGQHDMVQGKDCEVWTLDDGKVVREACIIQGAAFVDPEARGVPAWSRELAVRAAFPLRIVEKSGGKETARMTVTKLDVHATDAALFAIPKTYKNVR